MRHAHPLHVDDNNVLSQLCVKYNSDKYYEGYTKYYHQHLRDLRDKNVNLLEIGVLHGASVRMWKDYFPQGNIFGIDINTQCKRLEEDRIKIFIGSQTDELFLEEATQQMGGLDIIVDDAGHKMSGQTKSFEYLFFKALKPGGCYIIEDLHTSYIDNFFDYPQTTVNFIKEIVDELNLNGKRQPMDVSKFNKYENTIESVCFYSSMCVIQKR